MGTFVLVITRGLIGEGAKGLGVRGAIQPLSRRSVCNTRIEFEGKFILGGAKFIVD